MAGLYETDPETGARRPRVLPGRIQTVLSASMPPDDGTVTPPPDRREMLIPAVDADSNRLPRLGSLGRLASILGTANDSLVEAPAATPTADRRASPPSSTPSPEPNRPRTVISVETPRQQQSLSTAGLEFIKSWERFEPEIYPDQANKRTIGYGHKLLPGEAEKFQHGIDKNTAQRLLASDVSKAEATVRNLVKVPLTQRQYDSLVSLVYNIGSGNFAESTALKQLKDRNYRAAADAILLWNKVTKDGEKVTSDGLVNRRRAERNVFLDGK